MGIVYDHFQMSTSIAEAKQQFCEIIRLAGAGKETIITKNSRPAAKVVPAIYFPGSGGPSVQPAVYYPDPVPTRVETTSI